MIFAIENNFVHMKPRSEGSQSGSRKFQSASRQIQLASKRLQ